MKLKALSHHHPSLSWSYRKRPEWLWLYQAFSKSTRTRYSLMFNPWCAPQYNNSHCSCLVPTGSLLVKISLLIPKTVFRDPSSSLDTFLLLIYAAAINQTDNRSKVREQRKHRTRLHLVFSLFRPRRYQSKVCYLTSHDCCRNEWAWSLQSLFLTKRKELWLCVSGRFKIRSGMPQLRNCGYAQVEDLACAVVCRKELWLCANGKI